MKDIHARKNAGYAGDCDDAWANFRYSELFGIPAFKGCLVRLSDKFIRIANLTQNPKNEQVGEAITDTLLDLANYAIIAICLYEELQQKEEEINAGANILGNARKSSSEIEHGTVPTKETNIESSDTHSKATVFLVRGDNVERCCK
jgi:hypothetical protein